MCFYNGIDINRAEHIKLLKVEKEIRQYKDQLHRPMQSGFAFGNWPVLKPVGGGRDLELVFMHWELIPFYIRTMAELEHFRKGGLNPKTGKKDPPRNTLNAIGEEMLDKVSYKQAALKRSRGPTRRQAKPLSPSRSSPPRPMNAWRKSTIKRSACP